MNRLYYGDNLNVLRDQINDNSIDLIYLDPPFSSQRNYNLLFRSPKGVTSEAQITAFKDTWKWSEQAEREYQDVLRSKYTNAAETLRTFRRMMYESDMMAYLTMMTRRLLELYRVLKPTGSLYLHCDDTASHYLRIILDSIFGADRMVNEIIWKRTTTHSDSKRFARVSDSILYYSKSEQRAWNPPYIGQDENYISSKYRFDDNDGRGPYALDNITSPNERKNMMYEWKGHAYPKKGWRYSQETMQKLDEEGRIWYPPDKNQRPRLKRYLEEGKGRVLDNVWTDITPINSQARERLGYPTQKPLALLERIISASSNPDDVILDPFCGCGTAVHAAHKLGRQWLGIDITHLAISLIEKRLRDAFPDIAFEVEGVPKDLEGARDLALRDKYQFQWWACSLVNAQPYQSQKKGADRGIDGLIFFTDVVNQKPQTQKIIVSVKGGENVGVAMIRELITVMQQNEAEIGLFVTLAEPTQPMRSEAAAAGFYQNVNGQQFPRVQILTIDELLSSHKQPQFIDLSHGAETFKKAQTEKTNDQQGTLL